MFGSVATVTISYPRMGDDCGCPKANGRSAPGLMNQSLHEPVARYAEFRFYAELNDFLPEVKRGRSFTSAFYGTPSVKDTVEAIGVPHTEIDLIFVDGESVSFDYRLEGRERVAVYPVFERFDISTLTRLRPTPLRTVRFLADVHLGTLARYLRMIGLDTAYHNGMTDEQIIQLSRTERRIILTRDRGLLKNGSVTHGYWIRETDPRRQLAEVVGQFHLQETIRPFTRCIRCNGVLAKTDRETVRSVVPVGVYQSFEFFTRCDSCRQVYWAGSHFERMTEMLSDIL